MGLNRNLALALIIQSFIVLEVSLETENQNPVHTQSNVVSDLIEKTIKQQYSPSEAPPNRVTDHVLAFGLDDKFKQTVQNLPNRHQRIPSAKDHSSVSPFTGDVIYGQSSVDVANTGSDLKVLPVATFKTKSIDNHRRLNSSTSFDSKVARYIQGNINQSRISSYNNGFVAFEKLPFKTSYLTKTFTNLTENRRPNSNGLGITKHTSYEVSELGSEGLVDKTASLNGVFDYGTILWNDPTLFSNRFKRESLGKNDVRHNYSFELRKVVNFDEEMVTAESGLQNSSSSQKPTQNLNRIPFSWNTSSDASIMKTNYEGLFQPSDTSYGLLTDYTSKIPMWGQNISSLDEYSTNPLKISGAVFKLPIDPSVLTTARSSLSSSATPLTTPTPSPLPPSTSRHRLTTSSVPKPSPTSDPWPVKLAAETHGDLILGGLMMVHEREDSVTCGPIMPQGGIQALETMLYTLDVINSMPDAPFTLGAHILDDCDKDTYGLEMAVDFIKGEERFVIGRI